MKKSLLYLFLLKAIFQILSLHCQKSVVFNGKSYNVYPYKVYTYGKFEVNRNNLNIEGNFIPPVFENYPDGDYLVYSANPKFKNCRAIEKQLVCDTIWKVYATFRLIDGKKNGDVVFYQYRNQEPILTLPYANDVLNGQVKLSKSHHWAFSLDGQSCIGKNSCVLNPFNDNFSLYGRIDHSELELNYVNGVPHGKQKIFAVLNHRKYLIWDLNFNEGKPDGDFTYYGYKRHLGKLSGVFIQKGKLSSGLLNGMSEFKDLKGKVRWNLSFNNGELTYEESFNEKKKFKVVFFTGDTVSNLMLNSKLKWMNLYNFNAHGWLSSYDRSDQFALFIEDVNGHVDTIVKIGNKVSEKYYEFIKGVDRIRDTLIFGRPAIIIDSDNGWFKTYGEITFLLKANGTETTNSIYNFKKSQIGAYQLVKLYTIKRLDNGREDVEVEKAYYNLLTEINADKSFRKQIHSISKKFYGNILHERVLDLTTNLEFSQYICYQKERKSLQINYNRIERDSVSYLIRNTIFDYYSRQLLIVDTLYKEDELLTPFDPILHLKLYSKFLITSETDDLTLEQAVMAETFRQLLPCKAKHQMVFWDGKPMNQDLVVIIKYTNKNFDTKLMKSLSIDLETYDTSRAGYLFLNVKKAFQQYTFAKGILPVNVMRYSLKKGAFDGQFNVWGKWENTVVSGIYSGNRLNSKVEFNSIILNSRSKPLKVDVYDLSEERSKTLYHLEKDKFEIVNERLNYKNGELYDQVLLHSEGNNGNRVLLNLKKDQPVGHQLFFLDNNKVQMVIDAKAGFENSDYVVYDSTGHLVSHGSFLNGFASGVFVDSLSHTRFKFLDGYKIDTGYSYNKNGRLKSKSYDFKYLDINRNFNIRTIDLLGNYLKINPYVLLKSGHFLNTCFEFSCFLEKQADTAMFEYYFENGRLFSKGKKLGAYPINDWKFYRENGGIYKLIEFYDDNLELSDSAEDKTYAFAHTIAYYPNGQIMYKGYSTEYSVVYSCEDKVELPTDKILYNEFYDSTGKSLLDSGSGYVVEYLPDGKKLREGHLSNFKRTGTWIEYDRFGQPIEIGNYLNGRKHGRCLSGNLGDLNLPQNICFMDDVEFNSYIQNHGKLLHFSVFYYINGTIISQSYFNAIKE